MTAGGIVLAGGRSSRFGGDKLAALHQGRPVLDRAVAAVAAVADPVVLVLAPDAPAGSWGDGAPPGSWSEGAPARIVVARDPVAHQGPLAGLATGLEALPPGIDRAIVVAGDMPTLLPDVLRALLAALGDADGPDAVRLDTDPVAPLPLALRPAVRPTAEALLAGGRRSLRALLEAVDTAVLPAARWRALDPDGHTLADIDTREDLPPA